MRSARATRRRGPWGFVVAGLAVAVWAAACATAENPNLSAGDCVAGGCQQAGASSSSSSGVACTPNPSCSVSFASDIFADILDGPPGCTTAACHGGGMGGITLTSGQPAAAYTTLMGYTLLSTPGPAKKYVVPCDPGASGFPCNMSLGDGGPNPDGTCGFLMPFGASTTALTADQLTKIGEWITCGAPDN